MPFAVSFADKKTAYQFCEQENDHNLKKVLHLPTIKLCMYQSLPTISKLPETVSDLVLSPLSRKETAIHFIYIPDFQGCCS